MRTWPRFLAPGASYANAKPRRAPTLARLAAWSAAAFGVWLVLFHAALLWARLETATLWRPDVLARWIGAAALLAAAAILARRGSLRRSPRARLALVLLALLLHLGAPVPQAPTELVPAPAAPPAAAPALVAIALLAATLLLAPGGPVPSRPLQAVAAAPLREPRPAPGLWIPLSRPPPAQA
jgi:hypothetical protein